MIVSSFSELLREEMSIVGISQRQLAKKTDVSRQTIMNWINSSTIPKNNKITDLMIALKIDPGTQKYSRFMLAALKGRGCLCIANYLMANARNRSDTAIMGLFFDFEASSAV